jgi:hypothetical protein
MTGVKQNQRFSARQMEQKCHKSSTCIEMKHCSIFVFRHFSFELLFIRVIVSNLISSHLISSHLISPSYSFLLSLILLSIPKPIKQNKTNIPFRPYKKIIHTHIKHTHSTQKAVDNMSIPP